MASMNVVPLIDILLVLLILFMVITPLGTKGLEALVPQIPSPGRAPVSAPDVVVVEVLNGGGLRINGEWVTWETTGPCLSDIFRLRGQKIAFVSGENSARFGD